MSGPTELRCCCHRLLARLDRARRLVVLRCPRCKREAPLSIDGESGAELRLELRPGAGDDQ